MHLTPNMYKIITLKANAPNMYKIITLKANAQEIVTFKYIWYQICTK